MFMKEPVSGYHDKVAWLVNWNLKVWLDLSIRYPKFSLCQGAGIDSDRRSWMRSLRSVSHDEPGLSALLGGLLRGN